MNIFNMRRHPETPPKETEPKETEPKEREPKETEPKESESEPIIPIQIEMRFSASSEFPEYPYHQTRRIRERDNAFTITGVSFSPDDFTPHIVVISLDRDGGTNMKLVIDGAPIYMVDTRLQFRGNFGFSIDGKVVEFLWDVSQRPVTFSFSTRVGSVGGHEGEGKGKQWEDYEQSCSLTIIGI